MSHVPYASVVSSLMYVMMCTMPYLSQAVSMVSRYMHDLDMGHWENVKWILRYIKGIINVELVFKKDTNGKQECTGYVDSYYARKFDKCRSTIGYVFTLSQVLMSWRSTLQSTVALLTTKVEYMAMTETIKEAIWLQGFLDDLEIEQDQLKINCDSMNDIYLAKNHIYHARTKHIEVMFHFSREILEEGDLVLEKIHTKENAATCLPR